MEDTRITIGTLEELVLDVTDRLDAITTLNGTNPQFDLRRKGATAWEVQNQAATNNGMRVFCLVDARTWDETDVGTWQLYLHFVALPERPRLGPFEFKADM